MMIVMWLSRYPEFRADESSAALVGHGKMIAALRRLQQAHEPLPLPLPDKMAAFSVTGGKIQALFSSLPPLERRIKALQQRAG
jgi:heat shock protein HtpX